METVLRAHKDFVRQSELRHDEFFFILLPQFDGVCRRSVERAKLNDLSGWLTVLPTSPGYFDLTAQEFCDALALRYRKPLLNVPSGYDGCDAPFSLDHALVCRKGGLIIQRHNEVWDAVGDLAALVWGLVVSEPVVRDASVDGDALLADLGVREVWEPRAMALFDIRVVDTDARSICPILLVLCWLRLKLKRRESTVMPVLSIVQPLHRCVFQLMVLWVVTLLVF